MTIQCPKCGSEGIHPSPGVVDSVFNTPIYVCDACGYSGVFIFDSTPSPEDEANDLGEELSDEDSQDVYVGFFTRVFCLFADVIFLSIIFWLVGILITPLLLLLSATGLKLEENLFIALLNSLLSLSIFTVYFTWYTGTKKATPGKKIMRVEVVDEHNKPIGIKRAAARELGKLLLFLSSYSLLIPLNMGNKNVSMLYYAFFTITLLSYLTITYSKSKQSFWDKITCSYVVKKQNTQLFLLNKTINITP